MRCQIRYLPQPSEQLLECQPNHAVMVVRVRAGQVAQAQTRFEQRLRGPREACRLAGG